MRAFFKNLIAVTLAFSIVDLSSNASAERLMDVWAQQREKSGEVELIADPKFEAGFSAIRACNDPDGNASCAQASRYELKLKDHPAMDDVKPVWELAQWGSRSNFAGSGVFDGGFGWATPEKRLVIFPDGRVEMAVSGESELGGHYVQERVSLPALILSQTLAAPGSYKKDVGSVDRMHRLTFNLDFKKVYDDQNRKKGYDPSKHALIFPVNFTIQNLNRKSPGFGEYVWLQISPYDDRYPQPRNDRDKTQIDYGTKKLIYFVPPRALTDRSTHSGEWVNLHGDILPYVRRSLEIAFSKGLLKSTKYSDYSLGGVNIGYELTGLNIGTFQFRNLSLKMARDN